MFPMTVTVHNPAELNAILAAMNLAGGAMPPVQPAVTHNTGSDTLGATPRLAEVAAPTEKPTPEAVAAAPVVESVRGKKYATAQEQKAAATTPPTAEPSAAVTTTASPSETTQPVVTYNALAAKFRLLVDANRPAALALLAHFMANKLPDLKPEQYAEAMAMLEGA